MTRSQPEVLKYLLDQENNLSAGSLKVKFLKYVSHTLYDTYGLDLYCYFSASPSGNWCPYCTHCATTPKVWLSIQKTQACFPGGVSTVLEGAAIFKRNSNHMDHPRWNNEKQRYQPLLHLIFTTHDL
jgi:hypothetical protein